MTAKRSATFLLGKVIIDAGSAAIGSVVIAAGNAVIGKLAANTAATYIGDVVLQAGTAAIGKLAANSGVTIGAVEIAASQTVALAAGAAAVGTVGVTSVTLPTTLFASTTNVATAGSRVALASSQALLEGVEITAKDTNTGVIYVGTAAGVSSTVFGKKLAAGQSVFVRIANLATVGLDSSVNGEGVSYIAS